MTNRSITQYPPIMNDKSHPYRIPVATRLIMVLMVIAFTLSGSGVILFLYQNRDYVRLTIQQVFGI